LLVFLLLVGPTFGWKPPERLHPLDLAGGVAAAVGVIGVGLFLNKLVSTSTDRARLIEELERAQRELEASRSRDAELAVLQERERLARDLHDSLGHSLVTVAVQLEAAQRLVASDPARAASLLGEMRTLTKLSMEQLRRSLAGLRAPGLGDRPLKQALQSACDDARRRSGLGIGCHIDSAADQLPPEVAEALWRGGQEALANVERHARATEASLRLGLKPDAVVLEVRDNGSGLPPGADSKPLHYGLRGLRERAEGLGGTLSLKPGEPKGTLLEMRIPLIQPRA
jgi:signal transduction histidine kinase